MNYKPEDYRSTLSPSWCKGCTFYAVLQAITMVLAEKQIDPRKMNIISGIGCSSRISLYLSTFGMHTLHGRAITVAAGARLARPDIPVMVVGGDGDLFSIGMGHFVHAAHKNFDMTVICLDNQMYAMTKNQVSPTSIKGQSGSLCPGGKLTGTLHGINCAMSSGATFIARTSAFNQPQMIDVISQAFDHTGFSYVEINAPCRTYSSLSFKQIMTCYTDVNIEQKHNPEDLHAATKLIFGESYAASETDRKILTGVFWKKNAPVFEELVDKQNRQVQKSISEVLDGMVLFKDDRC